MAWMRGVYFSSSHVRLILEVGALSIINAGNHCIFLRAPLCLLIFDLKHAKFNWGGTLSINCNRILCCWKELRGAYFCSSYIEDTVLSRIYVLDSICRFYYICGQFVLHLSAFLHLWSIFITFVGFMTLWSIIAFVASRPCKNAVVTLRSGWSTVAFHYTTNLIKFNHTEVIMEEVDTHFQDHSNLQLHKHALQAPSSNQLLLGLARVLFLHRPKTNKIQRFWTYGNCLEN